MRHLLSLAELSTRRYSGYLQASRPDQGPPCAVRQRSARENRRHDLPEALDADARVL